jgi:hypothetical protein
MVVKRGVPTPQSFKFFIHNDFFTWNLKSGFFVVNLVASVICCAWVVLDVLNDEHFFRQCSINGVFSNRLLNILFASKGNVDLRSTWVNRPGDVRL